MLSMHVRLHGLSWCDRIRYKFVYWNLVEWLEHPDGRSLHGTLTAGGQFVVIFICGRSDGTAFKPDAVGCDVVAAFAGKETALAADVKRQPGYFSDCLFEEMKVICFSISQ